MNIKEIDLGIAGEEFLRNFDDRSEKFIKGMKFGRISVLPGEIIETPVNSSDLQYGE